MAKTCQGSTPKAWINFGHKKVAPSWIDNIILSVIGFSTSFTDKNDSRLFCVGESRTCPFRELVKISNGFNICIPLI